MANPTPSRLTHGVALVLLLVGAVLAWRWYDARGTGSLPPRGGGPLTVVGTGDALILGRLTRGQLRSASAMVPLLASADVALTNLEVNLLAPEHVPDRTTNVRARWPYATEGSGVDLRRIGINVVSLANNHTGDYGVDGIRDTRRILDRLGLQHVGSGDDLEGARAPIVVGRSPRRVAVIAVSTSSTLESQATSRRGEIQGRPGLNPLRFTANVTADPVTFETLRSTAAAPQGGSQPSDPNTLNLLGATIKKGTQTVVDFAIDEGDLRQILNRIKKARGEADVVIVSLHSHEPSNASDTPG